MNDLIYNVNKADGVIECTACNCKKDFLRITDKILSQYPDHIKAFYKFIACYECDRLISDEYTGKAVCNKEDVYNERYGKDVARTKAIIKREDAFEEALKTIYQDIQTLGEVNSNTDRDVIWQKHYFNLQKLLRTGKSLCDLYGYNRDNDEYGIADNIDLNREYTPHYCSLCNKTFLNYQDDSCYEQYENSWTVIDALDMLPDHKVEVCETCMDAINSLLN